MMKPMTTQEQSDMKKGKKVKQMQGEIDETLKYGFCEKLLWKNATLTKRLV